MDSIEVIPRRQIKSWRITIPRLGEQKPTSSPINPPDTGTCIIPEQIVCETNPLSIGGYHMSKPQAADGGIEGSSSETKSLQKVL